MVKALHGATPPWLFLLLALAASAVAASGVVLAGPGLGAAAIALVAFILAPFEVAIAVFIALSMYRLAEPSFSLGAGFQPGIADLVTLVFASRVLVRQLTRVVHLPIWIWVASFALTQAASDLLSLPTSINVPRTLGELALAAARGLLVVGVVSWLIESDFGRRLRMLMWITVVVCVAGAIVALLPVGQDLPHETLYAPTSTGVVTRVSGISGGFLPGLLLVGLAFSIALVRHRRPLESALIAIGALLLCVTVVLTFVRGGLIDLTVVLLGFTAASVLLRARVGTVVLVGALLAGILAVFVVPGSPVADRFSQLTDAGPTTLGTRLQLWQTAVVLFEQAPATGVGAGNFNQGLRTYTPTALPPAYYAIFQYPEQQILGLLDETGLIGTVVYVFVSGYLPIMLWRRYRQFFVSGATRGLARMTLALTILLAARFLSEAAGTSLSGNGLLLLASAMGLACGAIGHPSLILKRAALRPASLAHFALRAPNVTTRDTERYAICRVGDADLSR